MLLKDYTPSHLLTFFSGSCGRRKLIPGSLPTENMPVRMVETPKLPERKPPVKRKREREREPPQYIMHRPMAGYQYFFYIRNNVWFTIIICQTDGRKEWRWYGRSWFLFTKTSFIMVTSSVCLLWYKFHKLMMYTSHQNQRYKFHK